LRCEHVERVGDRLLLAVDLQPSPVREQLRHRDEIPRLDAILSRRMELRPPKVLEQTKQILDVGISERRDERLALGLNADLRPSQQSRNAGADDVGGIAVRRASELREQSGPRARVLCDELEDPLRHRALTGGHVLAGVEGQDAQPRRHELRRRAGEIRVEQLFELPLVHRDLDDVRVENRQHLIGHRRQHRAERRP
jgi:hypothetical protein